LDGAYFGASFPHILFQVSPSLLPQKSQEKYIPRIFGFKIHPSAQLYLKKNPNSQNSSVGTTDAMSRD